MEKNPKTYSNYFGECIERDGVMYENEAQADMAQQAYALMDMDPNAPIITRTGYAKLHLPGATSKLFADPAKPLIDVFNKYTQPITNYAAAHILKRDRKQGEHPQLITPETPLYRENYATAPMSLGKKALLSMGLGDIKTSDYYDIEQYRRDFGVKRQLMQLEVLLELHLTDLIPTDTPMHTHALKEHLASTYDCETWSDPSCSPQQLKNLLLQKTHVAGIACAQSHPKI